MKKTRRVHEPSLSSITDHALLRWLERVHGINIDFFRQQLLDETRDYITTGAATVRKDGIVYIFKNGKLITVLD